MKRMHIRAMLALCLVFVMVFSGSVSAQSGYQVLIHNIDATPIEGQVAYTTRIFLSALDSDGTPIFGLTEQNFSLNEDSKKVDIESLVPVTNEAIHVVLVMDASGSMTGQTIIDAKNAASGFLQSLGDDDYSAVISFTDSVRTHSTFTSDHKVSSNAVQQINSIYMAGTCLYDAAYEAIELASTAPSGRRAIILFTDGVDEKGNGEKCSVHALDDVISLGKTTAIPVYTLGMGYRIDSKELQRLSSTTGGTFLASRDSSELESMFIKLLDQLNNQYVITYISRSAPGPHTLTVGLNYHEEVEQTTVNFNLPQLPTTIVFNSPADGETLKNKVTLKVKILTQGEAVASIEFAVNGVIVGKDISEPYEFELDTSLEFPGNALIEAVAMGKDGSELARTSVNVVIEEPEIGQETGEGEIVGEGIAPIDTELSGITKLVTSKLFPIYLSAAVVVVALSIFLIVKSRKKKKTDSVEDGDDFVIKKPMQQEGMTIDELDIRKLQKLTDNQAIATLTIQFSDDPASIGQQFRISHLPVLLGRSADADILFSSKDQAISRRHALLEEKAGKIFLSDQGSKYGTYLNDKPVGGIPLEISDADVIRLGSRTKLVYEVLQKPAGDQEFTIDNIVIEKPDEDTREANSGIMK